MQPYIVTFHLDSNKPVTYFSCRRLGRDVQPKQALNLILFLAFHLHILKTIHFTRIIVDLLQKMIRTVYQ